MLLRAVAEILSEEMVERGVIEEIIDKDDLLSILPFKYVNGEAYVYRRENTISSPVWTDPEGIVTEGTSDWTKHTAHLYSLIGDVDIPKFYQSTMSDMDDQWSLQMQAKAKGMATEFRRTVVQGDNSVGTNDEPDGLARLVTAAQTLDPGGGVAQPLNYNQLDELIDAVPNGCDALMMREGTLRAFRQLVRAAPGTDSGMMQLENFGRPVMTHNGIPIIVNDFIPANETYAGDPNTTSIYAVRLNEVDGFHAIFGGFRENGGIVVEEIGTVQDRDVTRTRLKWYVGFALKSTRSIARLPGIQNV